MTFRLERDENLPTHITVHLTSGQLDVKITESAYYLSFIWHELGDMLREIEREQAEVAEQDEIDRLNWESPNYGGPGDEDYV